MTPTASASPVIEEPLGIERRRSPRHRRETHGWISSASGHRQGGNGCQVQVRDLSLHGVGYSTTVETRLHDTHWLVIADQSLRLSTRLRVVSVRPGENGTWDVGGEFF